MNHGSLFSGIGGFDLAAHHMGWNNVFHCEIAPFPRKILNHYWPNATSYENICTTDFSIHRGNIDIISGGFPCQPFSTAGNRKGTDDSRYLWPEMLRVIREVRPKWIVGENVYGLVNWNGGLVFDTVCADLENEGFQVIPIVLPAASINAPHKRDRIFFIANSNNSGTGESMRTDGEREKVNQGWEGQSLAESRESSSNGDASNSDGFRLRSESNRIGEPRFFSEKSKANYWEDFPTQSPICGGDDGIPTELDGITFSKWRQESIKGYGNAIVMPLVYEIFKTIQLFEDGN